jgi:hypothetical protein
MAVELRPDFDEAYFNLGKELTTFGDVDGRDGDAAAGDFDQSRQCFSIPSAWHSAACPWFSARCDRCESQGAGAERSRVKITRRNLGMVLAHVGEVEGLEILEAMVKEQPESVDLHWTWAIALLLHGRSMRMAGASTSGGCRSRTCAGSIRSTTCRGGQANRSRGNGFSSIRNRGLGTRCSSQDTRGWLRS